MSIVSFLTTKIGWLLMHSFWKRQISGETVGEVRTVLDMHERKAAMARESDAFVALPGKSTLAFVAIVENRKGKFW